MLSLNLHSVAINNNFFFIYSYFTLHFTDIFCKKYINYLKSF